MLIYKVRVFRKSEKENLNLLTLFNVNKKRAHTYLLSILLETVNFFSKSKVVPKAVVRFLEEHPSEKFSLVDWNFNF